MGFECVIHYYESTGNGEYNKEELKTKSLKIGTPYEDVSLSVLAAKLIAQLARKNMLITNIDIFEFEKKKISFKETDSGIVIKNRKFNFDDTDLIASSLNQENLEENVNKQNLMPQQSNINIAPPKTTKKALKYEIFNLKNPDHPNLINEFKTKKMAFTNGKSYPIYQELNDPSNFFSINYETIDDNGILRIVNDKFFQPVIKLTNNFEDDVSVEPVETDSSFNSFRDTVKYLKEDQVVLRR